MKNKKAGFFAIFLVLTTIILAGYTLYGFTSSKNKIDSSFDSVNFAIEFGQEIDKQEMYENEKVKYAASQAFFELAQMPVEASDDCKIVNHNENEYIVFTENCNPDAGYIADSFIEKITSYEIVKDYSFVLEGSNLNLKAQGEELEKKISFSGSYAKYNLVYEIDTSYSFLLADESINLLDFVDAYSEAERCKNNVNVRDCMKLDRWEISFNKDTYKFFKLKTKKYYFYEKQEQKIFAPIEFNFALE